LVDPIIEQWHKAFWCVPPMHPLLVTSCEDTPERPRLLRFEGAAGPYVPGDDLWLRDTDGRVSRAWVRSWSDGLAEVAINLQYTKSVIGHIGIVRRFSPARSIEGAKAFLERSGGQMPSVYEREALFTYDGQSASLQVDTGDEFVSFVFEKPSFVTQPDSKDGEKLPILICFLDFAEMDGRIGVFIDGDPVIRFTCDKVRMAAT